ncbi:putative N(4)-(beta-N-acetylglucosaminyl)-L-asparaginase GM21137 isoform X3 [Eurytemora carolleeae]|uniref:putative N(4)-(beta-N-acetylglucosaminyl)-L-asparaginase GM21137 isoform X2 n=1 Tax=Eurytemora carolleeae TaxID=1294199 RepID=UPI000C75B969|nr:putative N(4)-(beta-N-acetylglucosaminyl)-L-asparaginase GM21137 isoform X2 [Eurytemora carolleeae]XP_023342361.1 putative N(4)-(beta-N-acetylglucosaminyl)-L-asparaginase GM21137 isoform X3 [Eurytemora carolleeae]|eukprot:XP_023342360.1 putative N(4)-(beta-N-acetylglucosaminyl)-L-asparaginase GM21137 isoform X2 [Eurytemora affinis]
MLGTRIQILNILIFQLIILNTLEGKTMNGSIVVSTWNFLEANLAAWQVLEKGGNVLDSIEEGCTVCEELQCDGTVGYGGSPDESGETTLDAMIMDGNTLNVGAVGCLQYIKPVMRVARKVLDHTKHTLLVGEKATQFAETFGFKRESLSTAESTEKWKKWKENRCQPNFWVDMQPSPDKQCGPYTPTLADFDEKKHGNSVEWGRFNHDTIGMIGIDVNGNVGAGTSTNGASYKIPGRVGDSPIPGAGAYADSQVGAAAATGDGDIMMRILPSLLAVEAMRAGSSPQMAVQQVVNRISVSRW